MAGASCPCLNGDGSSVVETVFVPTLAEFDGHIAEAGGGLPVLDKTSCFANWLFQKSSFFIWELTGFPFVLDREIPPTVSASGSADCALG
jgi:hypothetical protein